MSESTVVIIQARLDSTRLPGKVLADLAGHPLIYHVVDRARRVQGVDAVLLATTTLPADERLRVLAREWSLPVYAGSPEDVLDRYYHAAQHARANTIMRVTGDCPLFDPAVAGAVLARFRAGVIDYASNVHPPTYPDGLDTEVFSFAALTQAWREAMLPSEREHVTPYIWNYPERFRLANVSHPVDWSHLRWTVDEPRDLALMRELYSRLYVPDQPPFGMQAVLDLLAREPELSEINSDIKRNSGYLKSLQADLASQQ